MAQILSVDNHKEKDKQQRAEINLHLKGKDIFVESANGNLYAAIDLLIDKLDRQVVSTWSVCKRTRTTRSSFNRRSTRSNCRRNNLHRNTRRPVRRAFLRLRAGVQPVRPRCATHAVLYNVPVIAGGAGCGSCLAGCRCRTP